MEMTIGKRIKACRVKMGMTQEELVALLYTKKSTISAYENDKIDIKVSILRDIAKALNTTSSYLVDGKEQHFNQDVMQIALMLQDMPSNELRRAALEQVKVLAGLGAVITKKYDMEKVFLWRDIL